MVKFGTQLCQEEFDLCGLKKACREVEDLGYDSVWLYDHFYPMSTRTSRYILEPWTVLACLAEETSSIRLGVLVTCNSYRFPSVLAKIAATADVISKGRLEFGIGAGWYEDEYVAYGISFPDPKTRIEQLAEAVEIIKRIWTQEKANFQGKYYAIKDLVSYPKPVQKPYPPVWIGGTGDRLLEIVGKHANYANFASCTLDEYRRKLDVLRRRCKEIGRNFEEIELTWHGKAIIVEKEEDIKKIAMKVKESYTNKKIREMSLDEYLSREIVGTAEQCVEKLQRFVDLGVTYFIPHFPYSEGLRALYTCMDEVIAQFK